MVKVVILCGGQGTRLREETEFKPKPLVEVGGMPILWHIMKHYSHYGFNDFVLCLGYKGRMIKEYFMDYDWDSFDFTMNLKEKERHYHLSHEIEDWTITFANTGERTMTAGRVKAIQKYIPEKDDFFLLTYGDGVSDVDIRKLIEFHRKMGKMVTITGIHPTSKYGIVKLNNGLEVLDFAEKPPMDDFISGGFLVVDKRFFQHINEDGMFESTVLPQLAKENQVALYPHEGFWFAMDTYKDYQDLNALWENGAPWRTWEHHQRR
jgi:glucose-1-phosphate cytidylyltransferase